MSRDLLEALDKIEAARPRVLVIGDACVDHYYDGSILRENPEGDALLVTVHRKTTIDGMAEAVANMAAGLGADARLCALKARSHKHRLYVDGVCHVRWDVDARPDVMDCGEMLDRALREQQEAQAVLIADHGKGALTAGILRSVIDTAGVAGVPVIVDPARGRMWSDYKGAWLVKCNSEEMGNFRGDKRCIGFWHEYFDHCIVTLGDDGMIRNCGDGEHFPTTPRHGDVTGCGDMVLAVLGVCTAAGIDLPTACRLANVAAGLKMNRRGAVPVSLAEIRAELAAVEAVA